jgi:2-methylcitrate dehydratase PrpD
VESIEIRMGNVNWLTVGEPYDPRRDSVVHAQFNAAYGFARALADGRVDLRSYVRPEITDPAIAALTARTTVVSDPAIDATAIEPARVIVRLKDGRVLERGSDTIKGSPQEPLTDADLLAKFHDCLGFGLGASRAEADRLASAVGALEQSADVARDLVEAFPAPTARN